MFKYNPSIKEVKEIAFNEKNQKIKCILKCETQGYSSVTYMVEYIDGKKIILQFKKEILDEDNFKQARKAIGNIVPEIKKINTNSIVYNLSYIPGITISSIIKQIDNSSFERILPKISSDIAKILAKCILPQNSFEMLEKTIIPELKACITNGDNKLLPFIQRIKDILNKLDYFDIYPLALTHGDISPTNILIDYSGNVTGLVDWEDMLKLPFGIDLSCIHWIMRDKEYKLRKNWRDIEKSFWETLFKNNSYVKKNKDRLQIIMHIGSLMLVAHDGKCMDPIRCDEQLDIELSYKIPDF